MTKIQIITNYYVKNQIIYLSLQSNVIENMKKLPLLPRIIIALVLGVLLGGVLPDWGVRVFNTFNVVFDQLLRFIIPLIIVGLVTPAIAAVGRGAGKWLAITAGLSYLFTVLSGLFSYSCTVSLFPKVLDGVDLSSLNQAEDLAFPAYFTIDIPPLMPVMTALVTSFMLGLGIAAFEAKALQQGFDELRDIVDRTIQKVIIPLLPLYIFGLFCNMAAVGQVGQVLGAFFKIILLIFCFTAILLLLQFAVAGLIAGKSPFHALMRMMPAYFTALGTSSSAATIPVTLKQTIKNGVRPEVAGFVIPLCATIHLSGSTLKIVSCALAIMMMNGMAYDFPMMLGFIMLLGVTMVAAPGVPGGAIMAALGLLDTNLGFSAEQQAMMITLYVAMDSFGTACNVTGDGAIALIVDRWSAFLRE